MSASDDRAFFSRRESDSGERAVLAGERTGSGGKRCGRLIEDEEEMARINIEASAALADWIDLYRFDSNGRRYQQLVNRAIAYLPMPKENSKLKVTEFAALSTPETAVHMVDATDASRLRVLGPTSSYTRAAFLRTPS
ncbi:MAG: hypothetical protein ACE15E_02775 [Acidobacteriota bacterium]